jgi:3'-phosphoadenosine 5'-phosphosulfate sulfotransferase (PAPS reductase)/FAD synthetase
MGLAEAFKFYTGQNVLDSALSRYEYMFKTGHVVISFSGGKDSGILVELGLMAKEMYGFSQPLHVVMRDEEIMYPGTFEYAERIANRPGVDFHWIYANQPVVNLFNRASPYFWVFDPELPEDEWVRKPPSFAYKIDEQNIEAISHHKRFGFNETDLMYNVIGIRVSESPRRVLAVKSSKGYLTKEIKHCRKSRPLYDSTDAEISGDAADTTKSVEVAGNTEKSSSLQVIERKREMEKKLKEAKTDEERQTLMKESQVIRLIYVYTGEQAKIIKKTLGNDDPADKLFQIVNQYYQANKAEIDKQ